MDKGSDHVRKSQEKGEAQGGCREKDRADEASEEYGKSRGQDKDRARSRGDKAKDKPGLWDFLKAGIRRDAEVMSEDEIKDIVAENDELRDDEKRMIHDIMDLGDMSVHEIMKPRVDMILVEDEETGRAALERMRGTGYSRLPVYHDDIDGIVGIVHYKDLIGPLMDGRIDEPVTKFMYDAMFVPETKDVLTLLGEMQEARQQLAIVVDEYGGTDGLVTVEDILEEIVGEIADETDMDGDLVTSIGRGAWRVDGRFPVKDACELGWPVVDSDDYETIAGWVMGAIDFVPRAGDKFTVDDYSFTIEKMRRSRISSIRVKRLCEE